MESDLRWNLQGITSEGREKEFIAERESCPRDVAGKGMRLGREKALLNCSVCEVEERGNGSYHRIYKFRYEQAETTGFP